MVTDCHLQSWTDLRLPADPSFHFGWWVCLDVKCTLDMSLPICQVPHRRGSWNAVPSPESSWYLIGAQFGQSEMIWEMCDFLFVIVQQIFLHNLIGPKRFVRCRQFCWHYHDLWIVLSFLVLSEQPEILQASSSHMSATAPQILSWLTEMIVRRTNSAVSSSPQKCIDKCSFSFASQSFSFQSTGSTEYGMSTFTEVEHHVLSDTIPFSNRLVRVSSVPFLLWSRPRKWPMSVRESSCTFCYDFGIRNTPQTKSLYIDMIRLGNWLRFTPCLSHRVLDLGENLQCSESLEIFHSNSIGSPSIRSNSRHWDDFMYQSVFSFHALTGFYNDSARAQYWIREYAGFRCW